MLLREHIDQFGIGRGGRLFRSVNGAPVQPSTWWRIWKATRALWLTPAQAATPLLSRPYDLRHSGVTWRQGRGVASDASFPGLCEDGAVRAVAFRPAA